MTGPGPCAKQTVIATIVARDGKRHAGSNYCRTPQATCPRSGMPTGVGYELCRSVCDQAGHAEVVALRVAMTDPRAHLNLPGSVCYIQGHTYACQNCLDELAKFGITDVRFGPPPDDFGHSGMDSTLGGIE